MKANLTKYLETEVPRYTSYPTALQFDERVDGEVYTQWLGTVRPTDTFSLYVHVPFCKQLCWYCGCHTNIANNYRSVSAYLDLIKREAETLSAAMDEKAAIGHLHFGGGTPTIIRDQDFEALIERLQSSFRFRDDIEFAVEIDPRTMTRKKARMLAQCGVNRVSLGVQDFAADVQEAINRVQPFDLVADSVEWLQKAGIESISFDLMYGLPNQTRASVERTALEAISLEPDRLSVFGYAHVPWVKPHQQVIDEARLGDAKERLAQAEIIGEVLHTNGYVDIGFDHYARPGDPLERAAQTKKLHRNFQGYTTDNSDFLLGLGVSSIGYFRQGFVQNHKDMGRYRLDVMAGRLPVERGYAFDGEDRLRGHIIHDLLCQFDVDVGAACRSHGYREDALDDPLAALAELVQDELVEIEGRHIRIHGDARRFARIPAAYFDAFRSAKTASQRQHSQAV